MNRCCLPTPSLRSSSALVGLIIPSTLIVPILLISLSVNESCGFTKTEWQTALSSNTTRWLSAGLLTRLTFCPRKRLFADRMVNPSPGPSSTVEFDTASLSLSVLFARWREKRSLQSAFKLPNDNDSGSFSSALNQLWFVSSLIEQIKHKCTEHTAVNRRRVRDSSPSSQMALLGTLTFGLRPRLPLTFLKVLVGFLLFKRSSCLSVTDAWLSTFTRPPLFLESSSGWIRGRTPPFDMVTPRRSWWKKHFDKWTHVCEETLSVHTRDHVVTSVFVWGWYKNRSTADRWMLFTTL